jgi:hypothetical protein
MIKRLLLLLLSTLFVSYTVTSQSISSNSPLCTDNSPTLELKASGGSTYVWTGPNNFTSNQQNPTISKATAVNAGTYTCMVDGKTSLTTGVKVGRFSNPVYVYSYTYGAKLNIFAYGYFDIENAPLSFIWTGPNGFSSTKISNSIGGFDKSSQGIYAVTVKDEFGCVQKASTEVKFSTPECPYNILLNASSKSGQSTNWEGTGSSSLNVCEGSEIKFIVDTTYWGKNVTIKWFKDDKVIPNATSLTYLTREVNTFYAQIYKDGCIYTTHKVKNQPTTISPYIENTLAQRNICNKGGSTILYYYNENTFFTDEPISAQWYKNGSSISNINYNGLKVTESGDYQVKVKAGQCEGFSAPVQINATDKIKAEFTFNTVGNIPSNQKYLKLCKENDSFVQINVSAEGNKKIYKNGVLWKQDIYNNDSFFITQEPGTYVLETKQGECISSDTLKLEYSTTNDMFTTRIDNLSCTTPNNFYYYINNTLPSSNEVTWFKNNSFYSSGIYLYPNSSGTYQATYSNATTGCRGKTELITINVPVTPSRQYFKIITPTTKNIIICKNQKVTRKIQINTSRSGGVWKRDGVIHDAGNSSSQTLISQTGKYWYEYNNGQCITYSDTVKVTEQDVPKFTLTQTCLKDNAVKLNVNSTSGVKYNWFQNGSILSAKDTTLTVSQGGKYIVEIYKDGCYTSSNEVNVGISVSDNHSVCKGDTLKLKTIGDVSTTYNWTGPNSFKSNLQNPIVAKTNKSVQGFYKLSATDKSGCIFTSQTLVAVNDYPAFTLPKTVTACAGSDFQFNQLISKPLTDSTETVGQYYAIAPNKNTYYNNFFLNNVTAKDAGTYNLTISGSQGNCTVKATTELVVDASDACRSISVGNLDKNSICAEQTLEIRFKTTGKFKAGTVFRAYAEEWYYSQEEGQEKTRKLILGTATKSPIKVGGFTGGRGYDIKVESEDGLITVGSQYVYTTYTSYNYIADTISGQSRNAECTSFPLKLAYNNTYTNQQWFFNGDTLKKETGKTITATKSGKYTFVGTESSGCQATFSKDVIIGKLDKPILYGDKENELNCFNESVTLKVPQYTNTKYAWRRDGVLQTETSSSINAIMAGKYTVEISKETCKATSDTIVVKQKPDKIFNLNAGTYQNNDNNKVLQTHIITNVLGNGIYKYQLFKDNQLFAEGKDNTIMIKDVGKYFFKVSKGDCEAISNVVDYKGIITTNLYQRNLSFNGNYDYSTKTVQLCDTNFVRQFYAYSNEHLRDGFVSRKLTAYRDDKPLPTFQQGLNIYPSSSVEKGSYSDYFYLHFKGVGKYYMIEEITLKDSTKLKYRYGDMTVQVSSVVNLGTKIPQNLFVCADSTVVYGDTYLTRQERPVGYTWKKDGAIFKKTNAGESPNLTIKQSGTYVLETTYKGGCIANATPVKVELNKMQVILTDVPSIEICDGTAIRLYPNIYSGYPFDTIKITYQVLKDGKEYEKGFTYKDSYHRGYSYFDFSLKDAGIYTVKTQQGKCQGTSDNLELKTIKVPNTINYADSVLFCQTQSVSLKTTDNSALSYLWERDGDFLKDATKATLNINQGGVYRALNRQGACWNYTPKVRAKVLENILPTAVISGSKDLNYADTAKVSIAFTSHSPWTFKLSDGKEYTATKSPFEVSLRPQFSTNYTLSEVKNVCGIGTVSGEANIKILILSSEPEDGINLNVFPVPTKEYLTIQLLTDKPEKMEWQLVTITGGILQSEVSVNKSNKHEASVSMKNLAEGTYFLHIQAGDKNLTRKVIKTN